MVGYGSHNHGGRHDGPARSSGWRTARRQSATNCVIIGALLLALLGPACSSVDSTTGPTTIRSTAPTTTTTADVAGTSPEHEIRQVVEEWYQVALELIEHPDPNDPRLGQYLTGDFLAGFRASLQTQLQDGTIGRLPPQSQSMLRVDEVTVDGDVATITECVVDDGWLIDGATGEILNDRVVTRTRQVTTRRVDGRWRLAADEVISESDGVSGCAR